jgi:hypothetical protein
MLLLYNYASFEKSGIFINYANAPFWEDVVRFFNDFQQYRIAF